MHSNTAFNSIYVVCIMLSQQISVCGSNLILLRILLSSTCKASTMSVPTIHLLINPLLDHVRMYIYIYIYDTWSLLNGFVPITVYISTSAIFIVKHTRNYLKGRPHCCLLFTVEIAMKEDLVNVHFYYSKDEMILVLFLKV